MIVTFVITYLMAALVLPDDWDGVLDLISHYAEVRRPLWTLFGLNSLAVFAANIVRSGAPHANNYISLGVGLAIAAILIVVHQRVLHLVFLAMVIALQVFSLGNLTITG